MIGRRRRGVGLAGAVSLVLVGLLAAAVAGFAASPAAADRRGDGASQFVTIELEPVTDIPWASPRPVPARVIVEARRAVSGVLEVTDEPRGGSATIWEFDLDLAAGTTADIPVTLTTGWDGVEAAAVLRSGGEALGTAALRQSGNTDSGGDLVAVLGIDDPPRRVTEVGTGRSLPTVEVGNDLRLVTGVSTVVATPAAVRGLGDDSAARQALDAWVRGGGQLIVDGPRESLEPRYHTEPTANPDRFHDGAGSVLYDERWRDGIPIGGYVGSDGLRSLVEAQGLGRGSGGELALLAGLALPAAGVIAAVLLVYAVLAGPVLFLGAGAAGWQRRIWVVLPALALVVASAILVVGFVDRNSRSEAHITIVEVDATGSRATTDLLVGSGFGGNRELETPEGWRYLGQGPTDGPRPVRLRVGRTTRVGVEMPSGANAVIRLAGPAPDYDGLLTIEEIEAGPDGAIRAEVTNHAEVDLREAIAFLGNARTEIGDLPAGETVAIEVEPDDGSTGTMRELLLWPRVETRWSDRGAQLAVPTDDDAATAAGTWTEWRIDQGTTASPENVLGVVAWSDGLAAPVGGAETGRTALFARAPVPPGLGPEVGFATSARLPSYQGNPIFDGAFVGYTEDLRLVLGADTEVDELALAIDRQSSAVAVQVDGTWRYLELPETGDATIALPPEAVVDGEALLRSFQPEWAWGTGATVRVVGGADDAVAAVLGDAADHRAVGEPGFDGRFGPDIDALAIVDVVEVGELIAGEPFVHSASLPSLTGSSITLPLEEGQEMRITMRAPRADSFLRLFDPDGVMVAENDDFGEGVDSRIEFVARATGTYELQARELGNQAIDYELTVELIE